MRAGCIFFIQYSTFPSVLIVNKWFVLEIPIQLRACIWMKMGLKGMGICHGMCGVMLPIKESSTHTYKPASTF